MLDSIENQYQKIGYIARSHGVRGEVLIISDLYVPTLFDSLDLVRIENTRGDLVPARIESFRVQEKNNRLSFFIKFEHVPDRTEAEKLKQLAIYASRDVVDPLLDQDDDQINLTSFEIRMENSPVGSVKEVIPNPAHPILQVLMDDHEQLLIPFVDEYIISVDEEAKQIQCQNLEQLRGL